MAILAPLVATWLPTKRVRVDVREDGDSITMTVEGAGDLRSQLLRDPQGTPFTLRGGGFVSGFGMEEAELAPTATEWADQRCPRASKRSLAPGGTSPGAGELPLGE
jgi:hypothetical protein